MSISTLDLALESLDTVPALWLRDDDFVTDSKNFRKLALLADTGLPMIFAAVPYRLKVSDAELTFVTSMPHNIKFCVHGYIHANNVAEGKPSEYPASVSNESVCTQLSYGHRKLSQVFGNRFLPMFVPPWNAISEKHIQSIIDCGYTTISGSYDNPIGVPADNLEALPCHVDVLTYPPAHPYPLKSNDLLYNELAFAINTWRDIGKPNKPLCILSHHASMTEGDIERYVAFVREIAPRFTPFLSLLSGSNIPTQNQQPLRS